MTLHSSDPDADHSKQSEPLGCDEETNEKSSSSGQSADFLRSFYFNHFLNNFQNLNDTINRLKDNSEEDKHKIFSNLESNRTKDKEDEDDEEGEEDIVGKELTDSIHNLCQSECRLCGKGMTIKSLRELSRF